MLFREPYCDAGTKYKASVHFDNEFPLWGGAWGSGFMGMWIGPGAARDRWGLAHEFAHGIQSVSGGLNCGGSAKSNTCGWIYESHANYMAHQLSWFSDDVHCSDMLANAPHLYLGSTRNRYCNWQFMEYLENTQCHEAVNDIWTGRPASSDPFIAIREGRGWSQSQLNDWDQPYASIYRYPYLIEVHGAWPEGYTDGVKQACPSGTVVHGNGGGCAPAALSESVYVGPHALVLGGAISGNARIEDQAVILDGATVSGGTVGGLTVLERFFFSVSDEATVRATFYPPGYFESGQGLSGNATLLGDVEYRGTGLNRSSGSYSGFVDAQSASFSLGEVTVAAPYTWRQ